MGTENALGEHLLPGLEPAGVPKALAGTSFPFRYNQLEELQSILETNRNEIAAIVMEPIRNEYPVPGFLKGVRKMADDNGAVLIVDEISAAFRSFSIGAVAMRAMNVVAPAAILMKMMNNPMSCGIPTMNGRNALSTG